MNTYKGHCPKSLSIGRGEGIIIPEVRLFFEEVLLKTKQKNSGEMKLKGYKQVDDSVERKGNPKEMSQGSNESYCY